MPHYKPPNYVMASTWDGQTKTNARLITIIDTYRHVFGKSLPYDKQYWTMCGAHFDINSDAVHGELNQVLDSDLINKDQFFGVDRDESIIQKNKSLYPQVNWFHGDFYDTMETWAVNKQFDPSVVNYDGVMQPKFGAAYIIKIFKLLDRAFEGETILIGNFVLVNPYCKSKKLTYTISEALDLIIENHIFPDHWEVLPFAYKYGGYSELSHAQMGVLGFVKKKHTIGEETFTSNRKIGIDLLNPLKDAGLLNPV